MMFLLDLFKFCEGYDKYTRQHVAKFIFSHEECARIADHAGLTPRQFASACSKEFCARGMTEGYLNCSGGIYSCRGRNKRPKLFTLHCFEGFSNRYTWEMMHLEELSDEDLFGERRNVDRSERRIVRKTTAYEGRI